MIKPMHVIGQYWHVLPVLGKR